MLCFGDIRGNSAVFLSLSELPFVTDVFCFFLLPGHNVYHFLLKFLCIITIPLSVEILLS